MKGGRRKKASGGESASSGTKEYEQDLSKKNMRYTADSNVNSEAEERKRGGRAKRRSGGKVHGESASCHAGRKPRKSGGRAGSNFNPLSSAHKGSAPRGHKTTDID